MVTAGLWGNGNPSIDQAFKDLDFKGKKVLDIGCWDGKYSFRAEQLGAATVYATDLTSHRDFQHPTFDVAHSLLQSRVIYHPNLSVYDVGQLGVADFDIVIYCGIYYHIKDPLRGFAALRKVMADGGRMIVEGEVLKTAPRGPQALPAEDCYARFYYHDRFGGDSSNWWVPTVPCLKQWVESSYFEIEHDYGLSYPLLEAYHNRYVITAKTVRRRDAAYKYVDPELSDFELPAS